MFLSQRVDGTYIVRFRDVTDRMSARTTGTKNRRVALAFLRTFVIPKGKGTVDKLFERYLAFSHTEHAPTTTARIE